MKINAAEYSSESATPEEIRELLSDDAKRGEFMILEKGDDAFVQVAGYADDGFELEYREGAQMFRCSRTVSREEAESAFLDYLDGLDSWKSRFPWEPMEFSFPMNARTTVARALAGAARFMYDRCCMAFLVFVVATVTMLVLQHANDAMGDFIPWPKGFQACVMFVLWANTGVAMAVSLFRRKWSRAVVQMLLAVVAFFCFAFAGFISYCVPTRMTSAPPAAWTQEHVCDCAKVDRSQLVFRGGISQREVAVVFEVAGDAQMGASFHQGSSFGEGDYIRKHYQTLFNYCGIAVELPQELDISFCGSPLGVLHKIVASGKTYLVYQQM